MKIDSAYLQNNIPKKPATNQSQESRKTKFDELVKKQKSVETSNKQENKDSPKFSKVTRRVLDQYEKQAITTLFHESEDRYNRAYTSSGKSVNMEVMIGRKVDIQG